MTENGKIFLVKNTIMNILAEQKLSIGLSLYIIKDIQQELSKMYNNIINQQLLVKEENEQNENYQEGQNEIIDMKKSGLTITSIKNLQDQAD